MPHTKSAKKRLRTSQKRRQRNRAVGRDLKLQLKEVQAAAEAGNVDQLRTSTRAAIAKFDKAGSKGYVHPNQVARKKSQLARLLRDKETAAKKP